MITLGSTEEDVMIDAPSQSAKVVIGPPSQDVAFAAQRRLHLARFGENRAWFEAHAIEIGAQHSGRFICIAEGELFVGDEPTEVHNRARAAHPDDWGSFFTKYIPPRSDSSR